MAGSYVKDWKPSSIIKRDGLHDIEKDSLGEDTELKPFYDYFELEARILKK